MIQELRASEFSRLSAIYKPFGRRTAVVGTLSGSHPGRIFVDDPQHPHAAFLWNEYRFSFLVGDPEHATFTRDLKSLWLDELFPAARQSHDPSVVIYAYPLTWYERLPNLIPGQKIIPLYRSEFEFNWITFQQLSPQITQQILPEGLSLHRLDQALLEGCASSLAFPLKLMWGSVEAFLAKGIGYVLCDGDQLAASCLSCLVGGGLAEVDVATAEPYRRKGLAAQVSVAYINACLERGLQPDWECWWDNKPSVSLATRLGFQHQYDYPVSFLPLS